MARFYDSLYPEGWVSFTGNIELTKTQLDYIGDIFVEAVTENIYVEGKKGAITDDEKLRKTTNISNGGIKDVKKNIQKDYKNKRYYGYDDRHNLEGTINNHSVYVSVYTKKKE